MTRALSTLLFLFAAACDRESGETDTSVDPSAADADSDGFPASVDCDDANPDVHPNKPEACNGADDDCDGEIDEQPEGGVAVWADADGDGVGSGSPLRFACEAGDGEATAGGDCDDTTADVKPGASEACDAVDNDCDGDIDENLGGAWYTDADGDGFGDAGARSDLCEPGSGLVDNGEDCDDSNAEIKPGATEVCNEADDDCDGQIDEALSATWYADTDGDGYGDPSSASVTCAPGEQSVENGDDCDDNNADAKPGASEVCNGADDDCDGEVDEGLMSVWFADADGDGHGDPGAPQIACAPAEGRAQTGDDCDDTATNVKPGATETCDGIDEDCDGQIDESAADASTFYRDADGDGYGDAEVTATACAAPAGYVDQADDCDDLDASAMPGGTEACGGGDEDCDGQVDEPGATGESTFYTDSDGDGYGDEVATVRGCTLPSGAAYQAGDCDDEAAGVYPAAAETCDGVDQDCDGQIDDAARDAVLWYLDADGDGQGRAGVTARACAAPQGFVSSATDCDDLDAARRQGAPERCNGVDDDCDGTRDEGLSLRAAYRDADGDGLGTGSPIQVCAAPVGYVFDAGDCDDSDELVNPDVEEVCDDGRDDDCDGDADCDQDSCLFGDPVCFECGDGHVQGTEQCDDGNNNNDDACRNNCTVASGCSSMALDKIQIAPDLWLCSLDRINGGNTWVQTYSVCNEAGGYALPTVTSMTRRGLPTNAQIASAMNTASGLGFDYVITGQPARSCSWDSAATSYQSCNGLGYVHTGETSGTGSNWRALVDGNGADYRSWPSANTTNVHTLISMCYLGSTARGDYLFDHRWR